MPRAVARGLRFRGVDVLTVPEAGLLGVEDEEHLEFARNVSRVIFTIKSRGNQMPLALMLPSGGSAALLWGFLYWVVDMQGNGWLSNRQVRVFNNL